jgi:NAD(P)-dependent dehydrogenase (short-subunit alcohol dehydrogenase family)
MLRRIGLSPTTKAFELPPSLSFAGQTVIVTGGNSGLGLAAAIHYVRLNAATVIITTRTAARGEAAKAEIEELTGRKDVVQVHVLDMSTFAGVKAFVDNLISPSSGLARIDTVLLNAGCIEFTHTPSPDGWEADLQVNTLSTTLLALLLLPWMRRLAPKSPTPQHLTIVGSGQHVVGGLLKSGRPRTDILNYYNDVSNYQAGGGSYAISKALMQHAAGGITRLAHNVNDS